MLRYLLRRTLYAVPILLGTCILTFLLFNVVVKPEQLAKRHIHSQNPTRAQVQDWLRDHGYDRPLPVQFARYVRDLMLFRFGNSDADEEPIVANLKAGVGPSFMVAAPTFLASLLTAILFAMFVAYYRGTYLDLWGTFLCVLIMSISYLVYIMAGQFILGKVLKYFPLAGYCADPADGSSCCCRWSSASSPNWARSSVSTEPQSWTRLGKTTSAPRAPRGSGSVPCSSSTSSRTPPSQS